MADPRFYSRSGPFSLGDLAKLTGTALAPGADAAFNVTDVAHLEDLEPGQIAYAQRPRDTASLAGVNDIALILAPEAPRANLTPQVLLATDPQRVFAALLDHFYPAKKQPKLDPGAAVAPTAILGEDCELERNVIIGAHAEIGVGTIIGANTVIGPGVRIGRWCRIGSGISIQYALIGDRVAILPNAVIGADGFGYVMGREGHRKLQQIGRVILQDDVEVGALTAIDRGALRDTVIGQGTKIDNLCQIAHNCQIGRHCVIAALTGIAGSVELGDFVAIGGCAGIADHLTIGAGAVLAARSGVTRDVPAGETWAGYPARPVAQWRREVASLARMVKNKGGRP